MTLPPFHSVSRPVKPRNCQLPSSLVMVKAARSGCRPRQQQRLRGLDVNLVLATDARRRISPSWINRSSAKEKWTPWPRSCKHGPPSCVADGNRADRPEAGPGGQCTFRVVDGGDQGYDALAALTVSRRRQGSPPLSVAHRTPLASAETAENDSPAACRCRSAPVAVTIRTVEQVLGDDFGRLDQGRSPRYHS